MSKEFLRIDQVPIKKISAFNTVQVLLATVQQYVTIASLIQFMNTDIRGVSCTKYIQVYKVHSHIKKLV